MLDGLDNRKAVIAQVMRQEQNYYDSSRGKGSGVIEAASGSGEVHRPHQVDISEMQKHAPNFTLQQTEGFQVAQENKPLTFDISATMMVTMTLKVL